jgi:O-antigen/teichoic acid export membrane protein
MQGIMVQGLWSLLGRVAWMPLGLALSAVLARVLAPAELGLYFLVGSVVIAARMLGSLGLGVAVTRHVATSAARAAPHAARDATRDALRLAALGGGFVAIVFLVSSEAIGASIGTPELPRVAGWVALIAFLETLTLVAAGALRGYGAIHLATACEGLLARIGLLVGVLISAPLLGLTLRGVLAILAACTTINLAFTFASLLRRARAQAGLSAPRSSPPSPLPPLLTVGLPMMATNIAVVLRGQFDLWLVGATHPAADLAVYGTAARLAVLIVIPLQALSATLPPTITRLHALGEDRALECTLRSSASAATGLAALGVVLVALFGRPVLETVYGADYGAGAPILTALSVGWLGNTWAGTAGLALNMTGHERIVMVTSVLTVGSTCILGALVVAPYGLLGLAWVIALGTTVHALTLFGIARRRLGIWTHPTLRPRFDPVP